MLSFCFQTAFGRSAFAVSCRAVRCFSHTVRRFPFGMAKGVRRFGDEGDITIRMTSAPVTSLDEKEAGDPELLGCGVDRSIADARPSSQRRARRPGGTGG